MSDFEQDTLKRQIRQLGDMVAAIVARTQISQEYESGLEAIRELGAKGLGVDRALLDCLDPGSAAMLLRDPDRASTYARMCAAEAELLEKLGRGEEAAGLRQRAELLERASRNPDPS